MWYCDYKGPSAETTIEKYKIAYPEMCLSMQGAAAIALFTMQYSQALDITKKPQLSRMFYSTIFSLAVVVFTRAIYYWWIVYRLLYVVYTKGDFVVFPIALVIMVFLFPMLGFVSIVDGYNKAMKYGKMYFKMMKEE